MDSTKQPDHKPHHHYECACDNSFHPAQRKTETFDLPTLKTDKIKALEIPADPVPKLAPKMAHRENELQSE